MAAAVVAAATPMIEYPTTAAAAAAAAVEDPLVAAGAVAKTQSGAPLPLSSPSFVESHLSSCILYWSKFNHAMN